MKYLWNKTNIFLMLLLFLLVGALIGTIVFFVPSENKEEETSEITPEIETSEELLYELPSITDSLSRNDMEAFFEDNGFTDYSFEYEIADSEKDTVLRMNVSGKVSKDAFILVTLSAGNNEQELIVVVPDFSQYSLAEVKAWASTNSITLKIEYNVSDTVKKGDILSQSVLSNTEIKAGDTVKIVISDGKGISILEIKDKTKADVESWAKEYGIENITYKTEYSDSYEKDQVISIKPKSGVVISSDYPVTVTVSLGIKANVKSGYEGKTLKELEKYIQSLDSSLVLVDSKDRYYSESYEKDTIYSYDTGEKDNGDVIQYSISLGKFSLSSSEFNSLTKTKANELIESYKAKKADISIEFKDTETSDSSKVGLTFDCSANKNKVTCSLGTKSIPTIDANDYNGLSESDAKSKMDTYKKNYSEGSISFSYGTMNEDSKDTTYDCSVKNKNTVSCKLYKEYFDENTLNGKTKSEIETFINTYNSKYSTSYKLTFNTVENDSVTAGKSYDCSISSNNITVNIAKASSKADIMEPDAYSYCITSTYEGTKANLESIFSSFTNVTYKAVSAHRSVGQIIHITVNGVTDSYTGGSYPTATTKIVIEICNEDLK